jgi:hypothetical protein
LNSIEGRYLQTSCAESRLNDKALGHTKLCTTQRVIGLLSAVWKADELQLLNFLCAIKVVILCCVDMLCYVSEIVLLKLFR